MRGQRQLKGRDYFKDIGVNWRIILKWSLKSRV
jgi:hypothetical protein